MRYDPIHNLLKKLYWVLGVLLFTLLMGFVFPARPDQSTEALNAAAKALYYQEHFDEWTNYSKREYVDKNFSRHTQETTALFYLYIQMLQEKRLSYRWEFP